MFLNAVRLSIVCIASNQMYLSILARGHVYVFDRTRVFIYKYM
jgi:hypothetical protein